MTPEYDQDEWLHAAFVRSRDLHAPSPAPVDRILRAGRARQKRRRVMVVGAAAASVLAVAVALPLALSGSSAGRTDEVPPAVGHSPKPTAGHSRKPEPTTTTVAQGMVDGSRWSVTLEFHPTLPDGYDTSGAQRHGTPSGAADALPDQSSLLCQRMVIGGVRIDHQGGPWSDCQAVDGAHDPMGSGGAGLWGLHDKGTSGSRLFVVTPQAKVAYGVVRLADGTDLKGTTVAVPHTGYRAWAVAIPDGKTITAVDTYEADGTLVDHDTNWR
ncbi:hypothetical protein [Streptomyces odontomachi]|uniref:hypothetical protein n=1 Tax=Streptomyces odontomachi TaxID=2944940 RepID=UPI00210D6706|nr:hypothetical protein [Streptomyces sp. ODS25]